MTMISFPLEAFEHYNINPALLISLVKNDVKDIYRIIRAAFDYDRKEKMRTLHLTVTKVEDCHFSCPPQYEMSFVLPECAPTHQDLARSIIKDIREEKEQADIEKELMKIKRDSLLFGFFPR